jgi:hypothetical protein
MRILFDQGTPAPLIIRILPLLVVAASLMLQEASAQSVGPSGQTPEIFRLSEAATAQVLSLPAESIVTPVLCSSDGTVFTRLASMEAGVEDPISISSDGKTITRFGKEKINDIPEPVLLNSFVTDSDVYIIAAGRTRLGSDAKERTSSGNVGTAPASKSTYFIAHFRRDGTYAGSAALDLPFKPAHLGAFANGDFLIEGADVNGARIAIVASNGQLLRIVELKGDVHPQEETDTAGAKKDPTALPRFPSGNAPSAYYMGVLSGSQIVKDGTNLLLFRPLNGPVFSISPSGEVQVHRLKVDREFKLFSIKPTHGIWIAELTHHLKDGTGNEFALYALDPETGAPIRQYLYPRDLGYALACTDGNEFTFLMANPVTKALSLVTLTAQSMTQKQ